MSVTRLELLGLVEDWRALLCPEWRVILLDEPPSDTDPDEYNAIMEAPDDYRQICMHFTDDCLRRRQESVEVTIVHELLHALTRPGRRMVQRLHGHLPSTLVQELDAWRSHEEEQLVDRLARALVATRRGAPHVAHGTVLGPVN